jgi:hypothetical protein
VHNRSVNLLGLLNGTDSNGSSHWKVLRDDARGSAQLTNISDESASDVTLSGVWKATSSTPRTNWDEIEAGASVEFQFTIAPDSDGEAPLFNVQWTDSGGRFLTENVRS